MPTKVRPATELFAEGRVIILGVAASDCHVVANQQNEYELSASGFNLINLGACTPVDEFMNAFQSHPDSDEIVIGSPNGHAYEDLKAIIGAKKNLLISCPVIVGGNLASPEIRPRKRERNCLN